ncbi:MAG TPA: FHA domain-containing protein, partial [Vicinamibacterales bacterium]|nr:FHA domain-containing protein [Vicinamibacterales bacterium]
MPFLPSAIVGGADHGGIKVKLLGRTGSVAGRDIAVPAQLRIGAAEDNDFRIVVRGVSRHHARIVRDGGQYWLEDAGSTNGTFLNGQRVTRERLEHLDVITLGRDIDLIAVSAGEPGTSTGAPVRTITAASFEWVDGPDAGGRVEIPPGELTIGRVAPSNVLVENPAVSQTHARIQRALDHVMIQDLESANGTFVNATRIAEPTVLRNGDVVSIAGIRQFRVRVTGETSKAISQIVVTSQSVSIARDWQTRLVWSADELAQLEAERRKVMDDVQHVKDVKPSPPKPARTPAPVAPPPRPEPVVGPSLPPVGAELAPPVSVSPPSLPDDRAPVSVSPQSLPDDRAMPVGAEPAPPDSVANPQSLPPQSLPPDSVPSLAIAQQPPGPKSVIPFVPPAGSIEFREAETRPIQREAEPPVDTIETVLLPEARLRGVRLSGASG